MYFDSHNTGLPPGIQRFELISPETVQMLVDEMPKEVDFFSVLFPQDPEGARKYFKR